MRLTLLQFPSLGFPSLCLFAVIFAAVNCEGISKESFARFWVVMSSILCQLRGREGGAGLPRCLSWQVTVFIQFWVSENLFPVRRFICVIKLLATCNNVNNASNMDNNNSGSNVGNSGNYHNFWLVKVCNNFSRFPPLPPPETKK